MGAYPAIRARPSSEDPSHHPARKRPGVDVEIETVISNFISVTIVQTVDS